MERTLPSQISGIYAIHNHITGKTYYGSGIDVANRKASHFWQMRSQRHKNHLLQADFDEYGADSFEFELVEKIDEQDLRTVEQRYIDQTDPSSLYNLAKATGAPPATEATRAKMRASHTGKKHSPETVAKLAARPAETNGGWIGFYHTPAGTYPSAYQAADGVGNINFTTIKRWCRNPDKPFCVMAYRKSSYLQSCGESVIGKSPRDLGFSFDPA
jgi:group I intron endonuclease